MSAAPLSVEHLTVHYDKTAAIWDISFTLQKPSLLAIVGPNGAGKSSLIKAILSLVPKSSGRTSFLGKVAYVPQRESVDWSFPITVRELVVMGRYSRLGLFRRPKQNDYAAADQLIERVGLSPYKHRQISELSGGQQQRAFLARALLQEAEITFMDEPFIGIDQSTEALLIEILKEMRESGKTVVVVHHNLNAVKKHFDWALLLNRCLVSFGPVQQALSPEHLERAYGQSFALLEDALKLSREVE